MSTGASLMPEGRSSSLKRGPGERATKNMAAVTLAFKMNMHDLLLASGRLWVTCMEETQLGLRASGASQ